MAYLKHGKALCGLFKTPHSAMWSSSLSQRLQLETGRGTLFWQGGWQDFRKSPYINYACNFFTDSFFPLLLFEYSVVVAYLINVRGCVEIVPGR